MIQFVSDNMPENMREPFNRMLNYGGEGVSDYMKGKIKRIVERLLEKYKDE